MIIDFHNHFYPPEFLDAIRAGSSNFRVTDDDEGNPVLHSPGDYNVIVPGHRDIDFRVNVLDEAGVDKQVLTFTAPGSVATSVNPISILTPVMISTVRQATTTAPWSPR